MRISNCLSVHFMGYSLKGNSLVEAGRVILSFYYQEYHIGIIGAFRPFYFGRDAPISVSK